jgi:hypothetical protein
MEGTLHKKKLSTKKFTRIPQGSGKLAEVSPIWGKCDSIK